MKIKEKALYKACRFILSKKGRNEILKRINNYLKEKSKNLFQFFNFFDILKRKADEGMTPLRETIYGSSFKLKCGVCKSTKTRYDGKDFELWEKDLWNKVTNI